MFTEGSEFIEQAITGETGREYHRRQIVVDARQKYRRVRRMRVVKSGSIIHATVHVPRSGEAGAHFHTLASGGLIYDRRVLTVADQFVYPPRCRDQQVKLVHFGNDKFGEGMRSLYAAVAFAAAYGYEPASPWHLCGLQRQAFRLRCLIGMEDFFIVAPQAVQVENALQSIAVRHEGTSYEPLLKHFGYWWPFETWVAFVPGPRK